MGLIDFKQIKNKEEEKCIKDITPLALPKRNKVKKRNLQSLVQSTNLEVDTKAITQALFIRFANHRYIINNAKLFGAWESDFITVTESMYVYEIECKMSKSDFNDDFNKKEKHSLLESSDEKDFLLKPNKFFYCAPRGMIASYEIPAYAGLMEVSLVKGELICQTVKEAPFLHKGDVFTSIKDPLLQKLSWRYRDIMLQSYDGAINILPVEEKQLSLQK